ADDDVPAAREGAQHERPGPRLGEPELNAVGVQHHDLADGREERRARDHDALGRMRDPLVGGLDVCRGEVRSVMELHPLAEVERVLLAVGRDLPPGGKVGDDGLPVARVPPQERVVHRALRPDVGHGARLVDVEVRRRRVDTVAERASPLGAWIGPNPGVLGRGRSSGKGARHRDASGHARGAEKGAAADGARASRRRILVGHGVTLLWAGRDARTRRGGKCHGTYTRASASARPTARRRLTGLPGRRYRGCTRQALARAHLTTATAMYREMDMRFWLERAEVETAGLA